MSFAPSQTVYPRSEWQPGMCMPTTSGLAGQYSPQSCAFASQLRTKTFPMGDHHHGKARVRVLRVREDGEKHTVQEYTVATRLFSPAYSAVFTDESNAGLVATDTQKNTVYVVAKRSKSTTPEDFGIEIVRATASRLTPTARRLYMPCT